MSSHTKPRIGSLTKHNKCVLRDLICDLNGISEYNRIAVKEMGKKVFDIIADVEKKNQLLTEKRIYEIARMKCISALVPWY